MSTWEIQRMLVVDDDHTMLHVTARLAESLGFETVCFSAPLGALAVATGGARFAVLVTDVDMPVLRGPELAAQIADAGIALPTLFVSGGLLDAPLLAGQRWLQKPFTLAELAHALGELGVRIPRPRP